MLIEMSRSLLGVLLRTREEWLHRYPNMCRYELPRRSVLVFVHEVVVVAAALRYESAMMNLAFEIAVITLVAAQLQAFPENYQKVEVRGCMQQLLS
jgi:hypothetical protein